MKSTIQKATKCLICRQKFSSKVLKSHIKEHIDEGYEKEEQAFKETQTARHYYKELFGEDI